MTILHPEAEAERAATIAWLKARADKFNRERGAPGDLYSVAQYAVMKMTLVIAAELISRGDHRKDTADDAR